ncbi:hypothetical protein GXP67_08945 [Rhodocytophaga rosea]|uniref:Uncharacterized protein n=1 Tax=Rhodocytophaga rosea TaxID=2704465 RepID=A0A6C0GFX9_9BACT|nr:DUF6624 domain-containing protein [Rhodocytophaga rosea]QHT66775.1 hypothetical protein GXP67_08945 [Rhodocytophaga rosea]
MQPFSILSLVLLLVFTKGITQARSWQYRPQISIPYDSLRQVLEGIYDTDQGIREKMSSAQGDELGKIIFQMQKIDSANQVAIKSILYKYGWLPQNKVGEKAADAIFYVVQHADMELIRQYFPALKKLARQKEARTTHAAMMEDRLLMYEGKKQIYGTQATSRLRTDGRGAIWPVQNPSKVNQLRKEAGFDLTVEENAKRLDAIYDPNEKLPEVK